MSIKDDVLEVQRELKEVKEQSFAMELLKDIKKRNKRMFTVILVILSMWFITIGYLVYLLNDISTITNEQEINDIETIQNSSIVNGGND